MDQMTEAIYANGVLMPVAPLDLHEQQRVRVYVQVIEEPSEERRRAALARIVQDARESKLRLTGPLPSRDELHERF